MSVQPCPAVTVVVPVYNRLSVLTATLDGVRAQTDSGWELIVVDDGSQEDVGGFVGRYADPRIRYMRQSNQGNAAARNTGIAHGVGEYVVCLDSDDVWHADFLRTCVERLAADPDVDVVFTQVRFIDAGGQLLRLPGNRPPCHSDLLQDLLMGYPLFPSSAVVRRSSFDRWGPFTPGLDDWDLWLRWAIQGCRFACIERPLVDYRIHDQNFNQDYDRRRAVHFATLDRFYSRKCLPEAAARLRERAYANQHFCFAVLAWETDRPADGIAEFASAVLRHPAYLSDLDFYTRIACAHQGRVDAGTAHGLSLAMAEATLRQCLTALFARLDLPPGLHTSEGAAYGWAYVALARVAYGIAHDMAQARCWLWRALRARPALLLCSDWAVWLVRSTLGQPRIQAAKRFSDRPPPGEPT
jgi:glycosyltransferase involved in cell wall biosynthesis